MEIPEEISAKYQILKKGTYDQIGLSQSEPFANLEAIFGRDLNPRSESPAPDADSNLFVNVTLKKFVEYVSELALSVSREGDQEHLLPEFYPVLSQSNAKLNEIQKDFESKTKTLVNHLQTERRIQATLKTDYMVLKQKFEHEINNKTQLEQTIRQMSSSGFQNSETTQVMQVVRDRIL